MSRASRLWLLLMAAALNAPACGGSSDAGTSQAGSAAPAADSGQGAPVATADKRARALATSANHTCALRKAGLFCWGANEKGQLGDESTNSSSTPVQAKVDASDAVEVAVHTGRSCIRRSTGKVACWGANDSGQLGDGTRDDSLAAVEVALDDVKQLALDERTTCALQGDGRVSCWGGSAEGELGTTKIENLEGAVAVHSGAMNTYCARGEAGWARCFRLDGGAWSAAVDVPALQDATLLAVASAQEVCGLLPSGQVACQSPAGGKSVTLQGSQGTIGLTGGLLAVCGGDSAGAWSCWNILAPAVLEAVGAPRSELARGPFIELATAGFRYCGLGIDLSKTVSCMEKNMQGAEFSVVADLPD
jgi:hypothetical protein